MFLLWLVTGWKWFELAGIFILYIGSASLVVGLVSLGLWVLQRVHSGDWVRERLMGRTMFVAMVLVVNVPVAGPRGRRPVTIADVAFPGGAVAMDPLQELTQ